MGFNIVSFYHLSDLLFQANLVFGNLQFPMALIQIGGSKALALTFVQDLPAIHLRGGITFVYTLVVHCVIRS